MRDIKHRSGAQMWVHEGDDLCYEFEELDLKITEIMGPLDSTLSALDLILRYDPFFVFSGGPNTCTLCLSIFRY